MVPISMKVDWLDNFLDGIIIIIIISKLAAICWQQFRSRNDEIVQRGAPLQHHCRLSYESCWVWCCLNCNYLPTLSDVALKDRGNTSARSLCEIALIYTMMAYTGHGGVTPLVLNLVNRWRWVAAARIRRYTKGGTVHHKHWISQSCSRLLGGGLPLPGFVPRIVQSIA